MNDFDYINRFKRNVFFKRLGIFVILISIWPIVAYEGSPLRWMGISLLFLGLLITTQYKCPSCGAKLDLRGPSYRIVYCNECGTKLRD